MYSIIIPIYNGSSTLDRCVNSILKQNNKDFELLLVNDGSTDSSKDICEYYAHKDSRIRVFNKINGGVSSARNIGIENAIGEWITFIDVDDYIEQDYIPINISQNIDLFIFNYKENNKITEYIPSQRIKDKETKYFLEKHLWMTIFRCPWSKFFKKSIINNKKIRFNEQYKIGEDTLFVLEYLQHCTSICVSANSFYNYTVNNNENKYKQKIDISLNYLKDFWIQYKKLNINNNRFLATIYHFYYNLTINISDKKKFDKWISNKIVLNILYTLYYKNGIINHLTYYKLLCKSFIIKIKYLLNN